MNWTTIQKALQDFVVAAAGLADGKVIWAGQARERPLKPYIALRATVIPSSGQDWLDVEDNPLVIADDVVEAVTPAADTLTLTAHGLLTADGPVRFTSTGTLPAGIALATDYWIIRIDADTIKLASTFGNVLDLVAIDITDAGTGTHTLSDTADTVRAGQEIAHRARGGRMISLQMQAFSDAAGGASMSVALLERVLASVVLPTPHAILRVANLGVSQVATIQSTDAVVNSTVFEPRAVVDVLVHCTSEITELGTFIETVELENLDTSESTYVPYPPPP